MLLQVSLSLYLADLYQEACFLLFNIMYFAHFTDFMLHNAHSSCSDDGYDDDDDEMTTTFCHCLLTE